MHLFIRKFRQYFIRYGLLFYLVIWLFQFLIQYWAGKQLDKMLVEGAVESKMLDILNTASEWLGYLTHPYAVVFFITGIIFSLPEWWPIARNLWNRLRQLFFRIIHKIKKKSQDTKESVEIVEQRNDSVAVLIEEIKQSDSWHTNLTRKLELGVPYAISLLERMRNERNQYDFTTLVEMYRTSAGKWTNYIPDLEKELRFVIDSMERLGYIDLETIPGRENIGVLQGKHGAFCGGDKAIKFNNKYLENFIAKVIK